MWPLEFQEGMQIGLIAITRDDRDGERKNAVYLNTIVL